MTSLTDECFTLGLNSLLTSAPGSLLERDVHLLDAYLYETFVLPTVSANFPGQEHADCNLNGDGRSLCLCERVSAHYYLHMSTDLSLVGILAR